MLNNSELVLLLHGLNDSLANPLLYFSLALTSYMIIIFVNLIIIATICMEKTLHQPIYIFLCNLCFNGICGATSFYPKVLHNMVVESAAITYSGCMTQLFAVYNYVFCEFTSLTVMAYDRYLAICRPLHYHALMTSQKVVQLLLLTWCISLLETGVGMVLTARLPLCGRHLLKPFCTNWEVVKLSCHVDTTVNNIYGFIIMVSHVIQTGLIVVSYAHLVGAALRSHADRRKFVQTCLPHLITLLVFTACLVFDSLYSRYGSVYHLQALQNILSTEFLVVPPLMNPIIYGINLQDIRRKILRKLGIRHEVVLTHA